MIQNKFWGRRARRPPLQNAPATVNIQTYIKYSSQANP